MSYIPQEVVVNTTQPTTPSIELWVKPDEVAGGTQQPVLYGRNRIVNGDFSVNQRGFTNAPISGWSFDRWFTSSGGGTVTYSAGAPALGELPESARSYMRIVVSGQGSGHWALIAQPIESVRTLSGKQVTVSFWARAASGTPKVAVKFEQKFGASGSAQVDTFPGSVTISTTWTRYSITGNVPSVAGKAIGTDGKDALNVCLLVSEGTGGSGIGAQANTFDIWGVQVEEGPVVTPYEQKSYADELRACQRYFVRLGGLASPVTLAVGQAYTTTTAYVLGALPVPLRAVPQVTYAVGDLQTFNNIGTGLAVSGFAFTPMGPNMFQADVTVASGYTVAQATGLTVKANKILDISAEL